MPAAIALWIALLAPEPAPAQVAPAPAEAPDAFRPDPGWKPLGRSLWFDPGARRLVVRARVVQTDVPLEHFLCRKGTKQHESILATEADARQIHAGLLLTGAEPGHPVRFRPKFEPPSGTPIALEVEWEHDRKARRADARTWVRNDRTKKPLDVDWVFAGSELYEDPRTKQTHYAADEGDYVTVANFPNAILDLPIASADSNESLLFSADPATIPPIGTFVTLYLAPRGAAPAPPAEKP